LGRRFSKHKITKYAKNFWGHVPLWLRVWARDCCCIAFCLLSEAKIKADVSQKAVISYVLRQISYVLRQNEKF